MAEQIELAVRIEGLLGDNLSCFNTDGSENAYRISVVCRSDDWLTYPFFGLAAWEVREGKSWQAELEADVAAYRAEPRPFCTNIEECMEILWPKIVSRSEYFQGHLVSLINQDRCGENTWRVQVANTYGYTGLLAKYEDQPTAALAICTAFVKIFDNADKRGKS